MQKEYEATVTIEVTFQLNVSGRTPEEAESNAEDLVDEALEGLGPGPAALVGMPEFISTDVIEVLGDDGEPRED